MRKNKKRQIIRVMKEAGIKNRFHHLSHFEVVSSYEYYTAFDETTFTFCNFKIIQTSTEEIDDTVIDCTTGKELSPEQSEAVKKIYSIITN